MDSKKIIEKLVKIAHNQQKIIHKLAQQAVIPSPVNVDMGLTGKSNPIAHKDSATAIVEALGPFYTRAISDLNVQGNNVNVTFKPGQGTQANYDHILKVVQSLQNSNVLMGGPYSVKVAG
jgi:hypothetical protein